MSSRPVWFLLVDTVDGRPYRGTSADAAMLSNSAFVFQFRKAVKEINSNILSSIDASQLLIYRNKDAFERRQSGTLEGDVLSPTQPIGDFGSADCMLVVAVPPIPTLDKSEPSRKQLKKMQTEMSIVDLKKEMPAPSSFSKHRDKGCWVNFLRQHPDMIICHRDNTEKSFIPACLLSPRFMEFVHDLDHIAISAHDCAFVIDLTDSMCGSFDNETQRMNTFVELFEAYSGLKLVTIKYDKSETDGSLNFPNGALYCNLEVKVEKGSGGGDPYMQCIAYYVKSLPSDAHHTQYPCFLLELYGTAFSVSGIVNTNSRIICDLLSPTYQLLCDPEFSFAGKLARLFASLRKQLIILQNEFNRLLRASPFPYVSSFHDQISDSEIDFVYQQQVKGLLFYAKLIEQNAEVVVKFCSRYNQDVHSYSHSLGFAPALFSIQDFGNYTMVVMEKLPALRQITREDATNGSICGQIRYILDKLIEKNYVHGDMRETNVLIDTLGNRVVLVDFDWAGIDGVDVYPPFMNPAICWPDGASTGMPLRHHHDQYW
eukprot:CAMPEP_0176496178 /NCGR_PEP_ID=MMETSP0200_2-20121128/11059_1 /TAXON_ID=947934 /ORGANISM="Chaetoceros sp., Strain GSL56" /LENGTH=541 /DNA_ID=CAMNT_0017894121 /DNA_START=97 /DNA_END=1719 /DNA_ORIENTATION=-